ncbi:Solute carrier 2 (Facilitated glucose transporter) member 8 [Desmophyllum pertusum]|uniref:Solute carrier 2 (Facilitated glucose transporter) member 8 n=1 Tax=Desmophyllum pertusum TaxID=174260 RepID=A0A9X0D3P6_9CNID|nr:Solute carrier 2 (Facilitated glucose transporter) member 8 [Desmophyllum pertusum]
MKDDIYYDYYMSDRPKKKNTNERIWSVLIASLVAAFGPFSFGYGMGYSSAAVTQLENVNTTDLYLDKEGITWFGSLLNIGAMMGGPMGGWMIDFFGRKIALMLTAVPFSAGWLMIGFGTMEGLLHAGRFFSGLGVGMASLIVPVYISETAPSRLRGAFGAFNQIGIVTGILVSYIIGHALNWRWSAIAGIGPPACMVILMTFMPETARWLLAHNKEERATQTLRWLRGPDANIEKEIVEIKESLNIKEKMSIREFAKPSLLRPFVISMAIHFFQQSTGINAVMFYCATIFRKAGFQDKSTMVSILIGVIQLFAAAVSILMIDRGGRRFLLIVGGAGMCLSCFSMGAYFYITINAAPKSGGGETAYYGLDLSWVAVTSVAVYIVGFAMAWGPCTWLIMSEIFPVKARGAASGIATLFNWFLLVCHHEDI